MDSQAVILQVMRPNESYSAMEISKLCGLKKGTAQNSLRHLTKGMAVDRKRNGKCYEYTSRQCALDLS